MPITKDEIDDLIIKVNQKANRIKHVDKLLAQMSEGKSRDKFTVELLEMITEYKVEIAVLQVTVDDYLKQVKESTGEIPLIYWKLAKDLEDV
jgi:two-component SAPR family response regulator